MNITSRSQWGSAESDPPGSWIGAVDEVVIHHFYRPDIPASASVSTEKGAMQGVQDFHTDKGWDDIGYSFVTFDSGRVYEARGWHRSGAHTAGKNHSTLAFALAIDGDADDASPAAYEALNNLIEEGIRVGAIKVNPKISGHTDYAAKSCPGDEVYPNLAQKITAGKRNYEYGDRLLQAGVRGQDVKVWQNLLLEFDERYLPEFGADGDFGDETVEYTENFQRAVGLDVDGVVGSDTRSAMDEALADKRNDEEETDEPPEANDVRHPSDAEYDTFPEAYGRVESIFSHREVEIATDQESRTERLTRIAVNCLLKRRVPGGTLPEQYDDVRDSVQQIADRNEG